MAGLKVDEGTLGEVVDDTNRSQLVSTHNSVCNMSKERLEQEQKNRNEINGPCKKVVFFSGKLHPGLTILDSILDVESSECLRHRVQHLLEALILPLETGTEVVQVAMVTQKLQPNILQSLCTTASS